ncbi:glycoside hydrolase family 99-like domain-containing protein [Pedobacter sp. BG31]|uniref:glycoside hydrolase family 99-like domain-containing protein n=1 Tax=Pedobacter sp. BG31 TaxID=3349697 RepID=UPI0035F4679C
MNPFVHRFSKLLSGLLLFVFFSGNNSAFAQIAPIKLGAYYFDGWTGQTNHITKSLKDNFPERKPKWGWVTSTPKIMKAQIDEAANAGISFFSFCWYYSDSDSTKLKSNPLNKALGLYLSSPNSGRLQFNLLVANHLGSIIGPKDWDFVTSAWIRYFKDPKYLKVDAKPLITIFDFRTLIQEFGSTDAVKSALSQLRAKAEKSGLIGVTCAACISGGVSDRILAQKCGFDVLTAYNNHSAGFKGAVKKLPIDNLTRADSAVWESYKTSVLPYIPVITLNWDPRPWGDINKNNLSSPIYVGYSPGSVYSQVIAIRNWLSTNPVATKEKVAVIYAWNEYGEGAWLTPSIVDKGKYLYEVKRALNKKLY